MKRIKTAYFGKCGCGNIEIEFQTSIRPDLLQIRSCQCDFCVSHQAATATDSQGLVKIQILDKAKVNRYRFPYLLLKNAGYLVCNGCGIYAAAMLEFEGMRYSTINLRLFPEFREFVEKAVPVDYSNETKEVLLKRRLARWSPTSIDFHVSRFTSHVLR